MLLAAYGIAAHLIALGDNFGSKRRKTIANLAVEVKVKKGILQPSVSNPGQHSTPFDASHMPEFQPKQRLVAAAEARPEVEQYATGLHCSCHPASTQPTAPSLHPTHCTQPPPNPLHTASTRPTAYSLHPTHCTQPPPDPLHTASTRPTAYSLHPTHCTQSPSNPLHTASTQPTAYSLHATSASAAIPWQCSVLTLSTSSPLQLLPSNSVSPHPPQPC